MILEDTLHAETLHGPHHKSTKLRDSCERRSKDISYIADSAQKEIMTTKRYKRSITKLESVERAGAKIVAALSKDLDTLPVVMNFD